MHSQIHSRPVRFPSLCAAALLALAWAGAASANVLLVGNKSGASVSALDLDTGKELLRLDVGTGPHEIVVSHDSRLAVVSNYGQATPGNTLSVIDWPERKLLRTVDLGADKRPHGIRFVPGTSRVVVTTEDSNRLLVVDLETGEVEKRIDVGAGKAHMVVLSPDGRRAYITHVEGGSLSVVDLDQGHKLAAIAVGNGTEGIAITPDGRHLWVSNRGDNTVAVIDTGSHKVVQRLPTGEFPIRVVITADGKHALVTCAKSAQLAVFDIDAQREVTRIALAQPDKTYRKTMLGTAALPIGAILSPDGRRAFVAISGGDEIAVIDTQTWQVQARWPTGPEPDALAIAVTK